MNADISFQIRGSIGTAVECDVDEDGNAWGEVLLVRIEIDLLKTIYWGRTINVKGDRL